MPHLPRDGFRIVLTADRTLMADYPTLFDGIMGTVQTNVVPEFIMRRFLSPPVPTAGPRARKAPLGLRRIEASLLRGGFSPDDIAIVPPENLAVVVGRNTRIVAVASGDPFGLGMSNTTMTDMAGGRLYTELWFGALLRHVKELKQRFGFHVVTGGAGAWQFAQREEQRTALGVDTVVSGYAEGVVAALFRKLADDSDAPAFIQADTPPAADIPAIAGPTSMGVVEISRGCGKGCDFCTVASEPMLHLPEEAILADMRTNLAGGVDNIVLISEDFFRYGTPSHINGAWLTSIRPRSSRSSERFATCAACASSNSTTPTSSPPPATATTTCAKFIPS